MMSQSPGERIKVDSPEIADWMYVEDKKLVGGFSLRVIRDQRSGEARMRFEESMWFKFDQLLVAVLKHLKYQPFWQRSERGAFSMDLDDLRKQIVELKRSGLVRDVAARRPGLDQGAVERSGCDLERISRRIVGMIDSMTLLERTYPFLITIPRRCARIAEGAGVEPTEVASFFVQFKAMNDFALGLQRGGWRIV
jgi:hypothetical protein